MPRPAAARAKPVRRSLVLRLLVTALAGAVLYESWIWVNTEGGPERALLMLFAGLAAVVSLLAIVWVWKRQLF